MFLRGGGEVWHWKQEVAEGIFAGRGRKVGLGKKNKLLDDFADVVYSTKDYQSCHKIVIGFKMH